MLPVPSPGVRDSTTQAARCSVISMAGNDTERGGVARRPQDGASMQKCAAADPGGGREGGAFSAALRPQGFSTLSSTVIVLFASITRP